MTNLFKTAFKIGGPGSGNFGHAGRPGLVGGSAPSASKVPLPYPIGSNEEWIKKVDKHLEDYSIYRMRAEFNIELPEYKDEVNAWLGDIYNRATVKIRAKSETVKNIVNDDRFKNQYETKTSGGGLYPGIRNNFEKTVMNVTSKRKDRPIYGYIFEGQERWMIEQYGDAIFVLKDEIKDRVSFTYGDSLDATSGGNRPDCAPVPLSSPSYHAVPYRYYSVEKAHKKTSPEKGTSYTEAQIFGGVQVKRDVAKVIFTKNPPDNETIQALTLAGISYEHNPEYVEKSFSLIEAFKIGGPGSGNFGHAGRPGLVGGSAPSKGRVGFSFETIRENAGIRIDSRYMNLDNEVRNKIDSAAADFCTEYPEVKGTVKIFRVREDRAGVMAYYNTEDKAVILNSEFFEGESLADIEKRYQHNIQRNLTPKGTDFTAAIHHEMSHGLLRRLEAKKGEKVFKEIRNKSLKNLGLKVKDIGNNLSAYAASDSEEFIAEAFAEVGTSKNPRDLSKMAVGITLQYLRGD